jgi:hypothetical protein
VADKSTRLLRETGDALADAANFPVVLGFLDGSGDGLAAALIALLRSEHEIQPQIRDVLADALEGKHPYLRLQLARAKTGPKPSRSGVAAVWGAMAKGLRILEIGRYIDEHPGPKRENTIMAAMDKFVIERSEAYGALKVWRKAKAEMARDGDTHS